MTDRLTINGGAVLTEDDSTGDIEAFVDGLSVGGTGPVSGTFGDAGEIIPLGVSWVNQSPSVTTTSTTYTRVHSAVRYRSHPVGEILNVTGFDAVGVAVIGELSNDTSGEETFARLETQLGEPSVSGATEVSVVQGTDDNSVTGPWGILTSGDTFDVEIHGKVSGGTGTFTNLGVVYGGRVA